MRVRLFMCVGLLLVGTALGQEERAAWLAATGNPQLRQQDFFQLPGSAPSGERAGHPFPRGIFFNSSSIPANPFQPQEPPATSNQPDPCENVTDCRGDFSAVAYGGIAIDNFAADEFKRYLNPQDSGKIFTRGIFGFDFGYRLFGGPDTHEKPSAGNGIQRRNDLWIYGETVHGVRSADVNCADVTFLPVCQNALLPNPNPSQEVLFMLRNATSLEAFMGVRYEFLGINQRGDNPSSLYFKAQAGFLTIAESGQDVVDMHHLGLGLTMTNGKFEDSYLEIGWGRTDLFAENRRKRFKIDGYLERRLGDTGFSFYTQLFVDTDLGHGSDSVQTYIGFTYDLEKLWKKL